MRFMIIVKATPDSEAWRIALGPRRAPERFVVAMSSGTPLTATSTPARDRATAAASSASAETISDADARTADESRPGVRAATRTVKPARAHECDSFANG